VTFRAVVFGEYAVALGVEDYECIDAIQREVHLKSKRVSVSQDIQRIIELTVSHGGTR
jgi:hypothetical protein